MITDNLENIKTSLALGYILDHCSDWNAFCDEIGLNPWLINEGLADGNDMHCVKIRILKKYGIM